MVSGNNRPLRVAIVGGAGFAGHNVRNELAAAGIDTGVFSRANRCDLLDLSSAFEKLDEFRPTHIVNCAAHVGSVNYVRDFAADVIDHNLRMTLNIYRIAEKMRDVIVFNPIANCAYPGIMDTYVESELWSGPVHPSVLSYGSARRMIDALAQCYHWQYGVRSTNVIVPNMYGPFDSTNPNKTHALNALVIKFVRAVKRGDEEVEVWGTGRPIREWLYVKDFARLTRQLIERREDLLEPVNLAQNHGLTVDELVTIISEAVQFKGRVRKNLTYPDGSPKKVMDDTLFRQRFADFAFTPFDQGLRETIGYYQSVL